jgi:hypothetical protein
MLFAFRLQYLPLQTKESRSLNEIADSALHARRRSRHNRAIENTAACAPAIAHRRNLAELPSGSMVNVRVALTEKSFGSGRKRTGGRASALPVCSVM